MKAIHAYKAASAVFALAFLIMVWLFSSQKNKTAAAENRLNEICRFTKAGLETTVRIIKINGSDRDAAIRRIHGDSDITGKLVLRTCAPGLDYDAWLECVNKDDEACMVKMLDDAARAIRP